MISYRRLTTEKLYVQLLFIYQFGELLKYSSASRGFCLVIDSSCSDEGSETVIVVGNRLAVLSGSEAPTLSPKSVLFDIPTITFLHVPCLLRYTFQA